MQLMSRRCSGTRRQRVTDDDVERWVEDERWALEHQAEMLQAEISLNEHCVVEVCPPLGSVPDEPGDGVFRGMYVQLNSMSTSKVRNKKAAILQRLVRRYKLHFIGLGEVGVNWSMAKNLGRRLLALLPDLGVEARCSTAHNRHERISVHQQGGVGLIALGELLSYYSKGKSDFRGLGRWDSFILSAKQHHKTRVVQVYGVLPIRSEELGSVSQQQVRYCQTYDIEASPRELFESDLLWQLEQWRSAGERLIVMMDANTHVLTGRLCRNLTRDTLNLREITKSFLGELCPYTHSRGSIPIDGVWATEDISITAVKWLSFEESPGDHRACIFDFTTLSAIGTNEKRIVLPKCRRLSTRNKKSVSAYVSTLEEQFRIHRIPERLEQLDSETQGMYPLSPEFQLRHDRLDAQITELQVHSEKHCRKIVLNDCECSPDYSLWYKRAQIFNQLIRMTEGKIRNPGLLCKQARKLGIVAPSRWSRAELIQGRNISKAWKRELEPVGPVLRTEHLSNCLLDAEARKDDERAKAIREMIDRESNSNMWTQIKFAFADDGGRGRSVTHVERVEDGEVVDYTEQEDIERVVREETQTRFSAAASSSFCQNTLGEELGYVSDTEVAAAILAGTYEPPSDCSDSTVLLLDEIARVATLIERGTVRLSVTSDEYRDYWRAMFEYTSSAFSTVHFGHHKVCAANESLCAFFARKISFVARTGSAPSRWGVGLNVLLEKIAGVALVNKLRAILLMEGDFNMHNRLIFGTRMMEIAREADLIPPEQFAEKQSDGQDGVFLARLTSQFPKIQVLGPYPPFFGIIVSNSGRRHSQMSGIIKFSDTAIWRMTPTSKIQRQMAIHDTY
jgi:hypothetical protein